MNYKNLKYLIPAGMIVLSGCGRKSDMEYKSGTIVSAIVVEGSESKSTAVTTIGVGTSMGKSSPTISTGTGVVSTKVPCEYGMLNIDLDGVDGLPEESIMGRGFFLNVTSYEPPVGISL